MRYWYFRRSERLAQLVARAAARREENYRVRCEERDPAVRRKLDRAAPVLADRHHALSVACRRARRAERIIQSN